MSDGTILRTLLNFGSYKHTLMVYLFKECAQRYGMHLAYTSEYLKRLYFSEKCRYITRKNGV